LAWQKGLHATYAGSMNESSSEDIFWPGADFLATVKFGVEAKE